MKKFSPESELKKKVYSDATDIDFHVGHLSGCSVLGIDIYQYSAFPEGTQEYIPVLFNALYDLTVNNCTKYEPFIFQKYLNSGEKFSDYFVGTGDGGFQVFLNPIQALVFACYFQVNLVRFNSHALNGTIFKNLALKIGKIELRYALTTDTIYRYNNNFYGRAIINNARILSKDSLNRFLLDEFTLDWYTHNMNSIETLLVLRLPDFERLKYFSEDDFEKESLLFGMKEGARPIQAIDVLKIGTLSVKKSHLEVYNARIQVYLEMPQAAGLTKIVVSLGNLNTQGIS